jgi:hypothetical protein
MRKFSSSGIAVAKWSVACVALAAVVACGGGNTIPYPPVASANVKAPITSSTVAAILPSAGGQAITATFSNGFSGVDAAGKAVAVTGSTQVAFTGTVDAPKFTLSNKGTTATGKVIFGSCSFVIESIVGVTDPVIFVGAVIKVDPCSIGVATAGAPANGVTTTRDVTFTFGGTTSIPVPGVPVSVSDTGVVTMGDIVITTTPLVTPSGASGSGT